MNDSWLRDALRRATSHQPPGSDRVAAAFGIVARRRKQRLVAASCGAGVAVFVATTVNGAGPGATSLDPVATVSPSPSSEAPYATASPTPAASPSVAAERSDGPSSTPDAGPGGRPSPTLSIHYAWPPKPVPLQLYVLYDATVSMGDEHDSVLAALGSIEGRLAQKGVLFGTGLGIYRDFNSLDPAAALYQRVRPVTAGSSNDYDIEFRGGGDEPEPATLGLTQLATGAGQFPYAPEGHDAGFVPDARRVVVLVTDAAFKRSSDFPTIGETIATLRAYDITVVALQAMTNANVAATRADLVEVASGTGGLATRPVDCDGDGDHDLAKGAPLVCEVGAGQDYTGFADALIASLAIA